MRIIDRQLFRSQMTGGSFLDFLNIFHRLCKGTLNLCLLCFKICYFNLLNV